MKKAFSLIEVIVAITILSVVMVSLLQIKSENIFLLKKSDEKAKLNDYILMSMDIKKASNRNKNIFLDKEYKFQNDDLRREFKDIKVKQKDKELQTKSFKLDGQNLELTTYSTNYSVDDEVKKSIYTFKLKL